MRYSEFFFFFFFFRNSAIVRSCMRCIKWYEVERVKITLELKITKRKDKGIKEFFLVSGKREKYREGLNYSHYDYNIFKRINFLKNANLFLLLQVVQMRYHFFLFFFLWRIACYGASTVSLQRTVERSLLII